MPGMGLAVAISPVAQVQAGGAVEEDFTVTDFVGMFSDDSRYANNLYVSSPSEANSVVSSNVLLAPLAGRTVLAASLWIYHSANWQGTGDALVYPIEDGNDWDAAVAKWTLRKTATAWLAGSTGCGSSGVDHEADLAASGTVPSYAAGWFECAFTAAGIVALQHQIDAAVSNGFVIKSSTGDGWRSAVAPYFRVTYT